MGRADLQNVSASGPHLQALPNTKKGSFHENSFLAGNRGRILSLKYELPSSSQVRLSVYDMLGREVSVLVNERRDAGVHEVTFDGSSLASGVYFYRLQAGEFLQSKRLMLLK
jgi:hypothetical protein